ncbi:hypothetical protein BDZ97DRAFT_1766456 [Flammula alnicola]|nr:hypothetical protein BDZ97DRAFT_1766456 [Flammula alnicola]
MSTLILPSVDRSRRTAVKLEGRKKERKQGRIQINDKRILYASKVTQLTTAINGANKKACPAGCRRPTEQASTPSVSQSRVEVKAKEKARKNLRSKDQQRSTSTTRAQAVLVAIGAPGWEREKNKATQIQPNPTQQEEERRTKKKKKKNESRSFSSQRINKGSKGIKALCGFVLFKLGRGNGHVSARQAWMGMGMEMGVDVDGYRVRVHCRREKRREKGG